MDRRELLIGLGLSPLVAPSLVFGQDDDKSESGVEMLFVMNAHGALLGGGTLHLKDVGGSTIFFSDRPKRIAGHVPTTVFIGHWGEGGKDSFEANPPNGTLSLLEGELTQEIVVELRDPRWNGRDLIYDVKVLEGSKSATGGVCSLFIDDALMGPGSFRGQARRVARRTSRRTSRRH